MAQFSLFLLPPSPRETIVAGFDLCITAMSTPKSLNLSFLISHQSFFSFRYRLNGKLIYLYKEPLAKIPIFL